MMNHSTVRVTPAGTFSSAFMAMKGDSWELPSLTSFGVKAFGISKMWPYGCCWPNSSQFIPWAQDCKPVDLFGIPMDNRFEALPLCARVGLLALLPLDFFPFPLPFPVTPPLEAVGSSKKEPQEESSADSLEMLQTQEEAEPPPQEHSVVEQVAHPQWELRATFSRLGVGGSLAAHPDTAAGVESIMMKTASLLEEWFSCFSGGLTLDSLEG